MCGIGGISLVPGSTIDVRRFGTNLLAASEKRGTAAAGYAFVDEDGNHGYYKRDVPGSKLHMGRLPLNTRSAIFHTRNWTKGDPKDNENNHPLVSPGGTITLVHNGVIRNDEEVRELLGKTGKGLAEVDSAVIGAVIEELGLEATDLLQGYAACAWFDTETGDTIHLAKFKSSPVAFATLWDGSFAFASEPGILASALMKTGLAWVGSYPAPFEQMEEGEYYQVMDGEVMSSSEVTWGKYITSATVEYDWEEVTSGNKTRQEVIAEGNAKAEAAKPKPTPTTVNPGTPGYVSPYAMSPGSVQRTQEVRAAGMGFSQYEGGTVPKAIEKSKEVVVSAESIIEGAKKDKKPGARARRRAQAQQGKAPVFSSGSEDTLALFGQDHSDFESDPEGNGLSEADLNFIDQHGYLPGDDTDGGFIPLFFTTSHDGDYKTYTNMEQLLADLRWSSALSTGENLLVGPEEGDLRWVNVFSDIGSVSEGGSLDTSWVDDSGTLDAWSAQLPSFVFDGIDKLRLLVGA